MYRNALVPFDGSRTARAALDHVPRVVDPAGHVLLVEVIDDAGRVAARTTPAGFEFSSFAGSMSIIDQMIDAQRREAEEHLREAEQILRDAGFESVEMQVLEGLPGPLIVELARQRGSDVILMGTHGRTGFRRTLLGSVAEYVVRHVEGMPVLLVRPDGPAAEEEETANASGSQTAG